MTKSTSSALFQDDDPSGASSPWDMPTPRKAKSRAELLKTLLPASDVPDSYIEIFDAVVRDSGSGGKITAGGVARTLAAAHISADQQARIMAIAAPSGDAGSGEVALERNEFNALLALIGLAQEGEVPNLDGVDERRRSQCLSIFMFYVSQFRGVLLSYRSTAAPSTKLCARLTLWCNFRYIYSGSHRHRNSTDKLLNLQTCRTQSSQGLSAKTGLSSPISVSSAQNHRSDQLPRREPRASHLLLQARTGRYRRRRWTTRKIPGARPTYTRITTTPRPSNNRQTGQSHRCPACRSTGIAMLPHEPVQPRRLLPARSIPPAARHSRAQCRQGLAPRRAVPGAISTATQQRQAALASSRRQPITRA